MSTTKSDALGGVFIAVMACGMGYILGWMGYWVTVNALGLTSAVGVLVGLCLGLSTVVVYYKEMN